MGYPSDRDFEDARAHRAPPESDKAKMPMVNFLAIRDFLLELYNLPGDFEITAANVETPSAIGKHIAISTKNYMGVWFVGRDKASHSPPGDVYVRRVV